MTLRSTPTWYKDAIIYEVHVRAFYDSVTDGIGDFGGLTQKLDYLEDLGVTADLAAAVLSVAAARRWLRHCRLQRRSSVVRHAEGFPELSARRRTGAGCG